MKVKSRSFARGSLLIETTVALALLIGLGSILIKYVFNIIQVDNWTIAQSFSEATLTYETSYMERIPFEQILGAGSPFPQYPAYSGPQAVTLGSLSTGNVITGTIKRMRQDTNNTSAGFDLQSLNLFSVLEYQVNGQDYYKVRSVVRTR